jgi:hypothetical protein
MIALLFVAMILVVSVTSRIGRSTELRVPRVEPDDAAEAVLATAMDGDQPLRFIANKLDAGDTAEYREKALEVRADNHLTRRHKVVFLEVEVSDASDFTAPVSLTATTVGRHVVLRATGVSVPNVLAAVLLYVRDRMPEPPHAYFEWSERAPGQNALRFLLAGEGDIPPLTHEILRRAEPDPARRPQVHVGG